MSAERAWEVAILTLLACTHFSWGLPLWGAGSGQRLTTFPAKVGVQAPSQIIALGIVHVLKTPELGGAHPGPPQQRTQWWPVFQNQNAVLQM